MDTKGFKEAEDSTKWVLGGPETDITHAVLTPPSAQPGSVPSLDSLGGSLSPVTLAPTRV